MPVVDFLRAKRDGQTHDPEAVRAFIAAVTRGDVPEEYREQVGRYFQP